MLEEIKKIIDKNEVISFDIFDTLVFRNVLEPVDIFKIMESKISSKKLLDFYNLRINAEKNSRTKENNMETTLDLIYEQLEKTLNKKQNIDINKLKNMELKLEEEFIVINPFMKKVYDYALKCNKRILIISDMYLPNDFLTKILKKLGYSNFNLYVSSDLMKTKANQELYKYIINKEKISPKKWLHIGDNKISDIENAKKLGINTYYYKNVLEKDEYKEKSTSIADSIIRGIQKNYAYCDNDISYWKKFGYLYASPIYFGFTNWLYKYTDKFNNIYFLARDGYIPKKIYELFLDKFKSNKNVFYLYSSRSTYQIATFNEEDKEKTIPFIIGLTNETNNKIMIKNILNALNLNEKKYTNEIKLFGFKSEFSKINYENYNKAEKFISYIYSDIKKEIKKMNYLVKEYLKQENVFKNADDMCIIDVGWGGSIQNAIKKLINHDVFGFYFGTIPSIYKDMYYSSMGYLFDRDEPINLKAKVYEHVMMYEFLFSAPHGTTLNFKYEKNKIIPILDDNDANKDVLKDIELASIEIIKEYLKYYKYVKDIDKFDTIKRYDDFIYRHNYNDMKEFAKLENSVVFHNKKESYVKIYNKKDLINSDSLFDIEKFEKEVYNSMWKYAYYIKGVETEEEHDKIMNQLKFNSYHGKPKINSATIKKALRNPKKAVNVLKKYTASKH